MEAIGLGSAAVGGIKSLTVDRARENAQKKARAAEIRFSPWNKVQNPTQVQNADPIGSALTYGSTGLNLAQNLEKSDLQNKLLKKYSSWDSMPSPGVGSDYASFFNQPYQSKFGGIGG